MTYSALQACSNCEYIKKDGKLHSRLEDHYVDMCEPSTKIF